MWFRGILGCWGEGVEAVWLNGVLVWCRLGWCIQISFLCIEFYNSIRISYPAHGILTKTVHKNLQGVGGGGDGWGQCGSSGGSQGGYGWWG